MSESRDSSPEAAPASTAPENLCFVKEVKNRCRICFTCVRECPAKAIRISKSQAIVVPERCIGCGNCLKVCSQQAKKMVSSIEEVEALLHHGMTVAACVAPSFPVEFQAEFDYRVLVGQIRALGFQYVTEVAFGADLVADRYRKALARCDGQQHIATTCPVIVGYVERYQPDLVPFLSPIVSPMVAMARVLRAMHGQDLKVVFIGPCIAKKAETKDPSVEGGPDAVITFQELRELFQRYGINPHNVEPTSDFDPPQPSLGSLFPISHGLLKAAEIREDILTNDVVATDGLHNFMNALNEFAAGGMEAKLVELLSCNGCIAGPGLTSKENQFQRRARVSAYTRNREKGLDAERWRRTIDQFADLDLTRTYRSMDQRIAGIDEKEILEIMERMGKHSAEDELNCGACGYPSCRDHAVATYKGLAESEMCLPYVINDHLKTILELSDLNERLATTQETLMHSERLASMGQLAAGVAHEINNPLGVVIMYTNLLLEECAKDAEFKGDLQMIAEQANRCKRIVAGLLDFARQNKVAHQAINVREMVTSALSNVPRPADITLEMIHEESDPVAELDRDQMIQVILNLAGNAYDAMPDGGHLTVRTKEAGDWIIIEVQDTGTGIPRENMKKLFEPFFTTKMMGKGTGLGLPVVYGIVKLHRGEITVESNADPSQGPTGSTFRVKLPREAQSHAARGAV
jgi:iron only hydrogenase large subunit-like protein/nitrogen-specific signal transduction histidine kinase